jgi:condensin complex subunit 3
LDISAAKHHILLFIQASQVDHENVRATALKVIFDLISLYGFDLFNVEVEPEAQATETETQTTSESQDESQSHALHMLSELLAGGEATNEDTTILNLLSNFLNNESVLLLEIACEGMCKLLLSGKISSVSLLVKLFLIWYDPSYQSQDRLKAILGYFFPSYSACNKSCRCNIAECYIHFMQTIAEASPHSTLIDIDVNNAADFIINLSAPVLPNEDSSHDGLALQILNYLLSNDDDDIGWLRLHCKSLNILVLTSSNKINAKNVRVLLHRLMELVIDKQSLRDLKKFNITLEKIIPTSVTVVEPTGGNMI